MNEIHAYANENGTYRVEIEATENGKCFEVEIPSADIQITTLASEKIYLEIKKYIQKYFQVKSICQ